jgi:hypothetical protein
MTNYHTGRRTLSHQEKQSRKYRRLALVFAIIAAIALAVVFLGLYVMIKQ